MDLQNIFLSYFKNSLIIVGNNVKTQILNSKIIFID